MFVNVIEFLLFLFLYFVLFCFCFLFTLFTTLVHVIPNVFHKKRYNIKDAIKQMILSRMIHLFQVNSCFGLYLPHEKANTNVPWIFYRVGTLFCMLLVTFELDKSCVAISFVSLTAHDILTCRNLEGFIFISLYLKCPCLSVVYFPHG